MTNAIFKFISDAAGGDRFTVVSFSAQEGISTLYRYEIEIKAPVMEEIDLDEVLDAHARFVTELDGIEYPVHGVLSSFEETRFAQNYSYYRAVLVPRLWKLSNYRTNEIYYEAGNGGEDGAGQSIDRIINQLLGKAGMVGSEYDLAGLAGKLLKREYRCQYNESDFDFISRLMENEGVFYYFEQGEAEETIVFINDLNYLEIPRPRLLFDVAAQSKNQDDCVYALSCRKQRLPENVIVRDYNPDEPSLDVSDITSIDTMGQGTEYIYGKNVLSDTEATYLSQIRAEEYICRKTQFFGESSVTRLRSGHLFALEGHPNDNYNGVEYLAVEVNHEGASLDMALSSGKNDAQPQYRNSFVAIPAEVQYRPPRLTPRPRITGTLHAVIDGELDSEYAQLDEQGRYKVSLPFDFHNEEHPEGLASARVRMMQPYAGKNRGMQFPMAKGTEVLLSFVDGDPDRPIIAGAINSVAAPGPVTADNQSESVIQTGSNNKIRMEDKFGSERVMLESPAANSWIRVGATNDPITLQGESPQYVDIGSGSYTDPQAISTDSTNPSAPIVSSPFNATETRDIGGNIATVNTGVAGEYILKYVDSNNTSDTAYRRVIVCEPGTWGNDLTGSTSDGIRIRSAGNLWLEARSKFGDYHLAPSVSEGASLTRAGGNSTGDLYDKFAGSLPSYAPTGMKSYAGASQASFKTNVLPNAHLRLSSLDTINTQEGNIYDFGGYWNYSLGNSYAEDHIRQDAVLNAEHPVSFPKDGVGFNFLAFGSQVPIAVAATGVTIAASIAAGSAAGKGGAAVVATGLPMQIAVWAAIGTAVSAAATGIRSAVSGPKELKDLVTSPGGDDPIQTWADEVGASKIEEVNGVSKLVQLETAMIPSTTWVSKTFGDSYSFNQGNSIEISHGNSESHTTGDTNEYVYGGSHEETKFNGKGIMTSWSKSGGGVSQELTFNPIDGMFTKYAVSNSNMMLLSFELAVATLPKIDASISMSTLQTSFKASAGITADFEVSAGLSTSMKASIGFAFEVEAAAAWKLQINPDDGIKFSGPGTTANKEAELKAEIEGMLLKEYKMKLEKEGFAMTKKDLDLYSAGMEMKQGMSIMGV